MPTFLVTPATALLPGICGYCGARRRITARARLEGTPDGRADGESDMCILCQNKGVPFLEAAFSATMPLDEPDSMAAAAHTAAVNRANGSDGVHATLTEARRLLHEIREASGEPSGGPNTETAF
jgi:hypothetical protein